jgi:hypothetical protein
VEDRFPLHRFGTRVARGASAPAGSTPVCGIAGFAVPLPRRAARVVRNGRRAR